MSFQCHDMSDWFDVNVPEYCILKDRGAIKHNWFNLYLCCSIAAAIFQAMKMATSSSECKQYFFD